LPALTLPFSPRSARSESSLLAQLDFIPRKVIHFLGPPGTGKTHLASALAIEVVKVGRSVYFSTLADNVASLAKAERDGMLRERIRYLCRPALLVVDEIGYLPITPGGGNLFFQLVNGRYERGAMILTSNRGFAEWGKSSAIPSSPPHSSIARCTTPSSSKSRDRVIACASTPTSYLSTFVTKPSSLRRRLRNAADGHQESRPKIQRTADHQPNPKPSTRENSKPTIGENSVPIDTASGSSRPTQRM
jgi:hypothetical protein